MLNARSRLIAGRRQQEQKTGADTSPEQHREEDADEDEGAAQVRLLQDHQNGTPTISAGPIRSRSDRGRLLPAGEEARQHEHGGDLGQLGWLADLVSADREPAVAALGRAGAGSDHEHHAQQQHAEGVERRRQPLEHPQRNIEDDPARHDADSEPDELAMPHSGSPGRHVRLAGRVQGGQAEQHQGQGDQ